jgi:polyisoprenoid-binding protein YceI
VGPFQDDVTARTTAVEGTAVVTAGANGNVLTSSRFTVDNNQLSTGDSTMDDLMRDIMETSRYPRSGFEQTSPEAMPPSSQLRAGTQVSLRGNMTLHGVTRSVTVPARVTLNGTVITVVATIPFRLADYNIHGTTLISVGDTGTMSFHLVLTR